MKHFPYALFVLATAFSLGANLSDAGAGSTGLQGAGSADEILARVIQSDKHNYDFSWASGSKGLLIVRTGTGFQAHDYGRQVAFWEPHAKRQIPRDADVNALEPLTERVPR